MKKTRHISAFLALLLLLTTLAGCNGGTQNQTDNPNTSAGPEFVYVADYKNLPSELENADTYNMSYSNGMYYCTLSEYDESLNPDNMEGLEDPYASVSPGGAIDVESEAYIAWDEAYTAYYESRKTSIVKVNAETMELTRLEGFSIPEAPERTGYIGNTYINRIFPVGDGELWVQVDYNYYLENQSAEGRYNPNDYINYSVFHKLDGEGNELLSFSLEELLQDLESPYIDSICFDGDGRLYISVGNEGVYVLSGEGVLEFKLEIEEWINSMGTLRNGMVGALMYSSEEGGAGGYVIKIIDPEKKGWGEQITAPQNVWQFYPGNEEYDLFFNDNSNLCGYNAEKNETVKLVNWIDSDVNADSLNGFFVMPDGKITTIYNDYESDSRVTQLLTLTKTPASEVPERIVLNLSTMWLDYNLRREIISFNKTNGTYRIRVKEYSEFNTNDDPNGGVKQMTNDIVSGAVPDLISGVETLPWRSLAAKGLFEDLYPYIDKDADIDRENLIGSVLSALEVDGKLYQAISSYYILTFAAKTRLVGDRVGWTVADMNAVLAQMPEGAKPFYAYMSRDNLLMYNLYYSMNDYIDWTTGQVNFDSEGFVQLLELAKSLPTMEDIQNQFSNGGWEDQIPSAELIRSDMQLLEEVYLNGFDALTYTKQTFSEDVSFIGFPNDSGKSGSMLYFNSSIVMTSRCADKEGAWQFMRMMFTDEYQQNDNNRWNFPISKTVMDRRIDETLHPEKYQEEGRYGRASRVYIGPDGEPMEENPITQADIDKIMNLINNADSTMSYDQGVLDIILEETAPFFADQKTAKEVVPLIQNRIQTYVSEQM